MFNRWWNRYQWSGFSQDSKVRALKALWKTKSKDAAFDVQRAFQIWADTLNYKKQCEKRCQRLITKYYWSRLGQGFTLWRTENKRITD